MKINEILNCFNDEKIHHIDELYCSISNKYPNDAISKISLRQMVSRLRSKGEIYSVGKNVYAKGKKNVFKPSYDRRLKILENYIGNEFPDI